MIDLSPHWLATVKAILAQHVPGCEVRAFGSRATWTARDHSDLDIAVVGHGRLNPRLIAALKEAFEDSDLPMRVDVLDWHEVSDGFREEIERQPVVLVQDRREPDLNWRSSPLGSLVSIHKEQITPSSFPDRLFALHSISAFDDGQSPVLESGSVIQSNKFTVPSDAVLVSRLNPRFPRVWAPDVYDDLPAICSTEFLVLRPVSIDRRFLHYLCLSPSFRTPLLERVTGTSDSHHRVAPISALEIEVAVPTVSEQRAVAHVLGTLDDKIELNQRMNETLEAIARALFKSWFVDFDPVRAKMEGRDTGLPPDLADLFPDRLVDSETGEIPEGWEVKPRRDCVKLAMGQSPPGSTYNHHGDGLPFFQGRSEFGFRYPEKQRFCSAPTRVANPEDTLLSVWAPVGDINVIWNRCCVGRGVAALRHKSGSSSFTYHSAWALQRELREYEHTGTVFGAINKEQLQALKVTEPARRIAEAFDAMSVSLDARIRLVVAESQTLAALRDTLLPKLISGEIRVPDAERALESAT